MPRYKITIEYDGADFCGWQKQETQISVQSVIEEAIKKFSGEEAEVFASGRTDSGVHALGQVAHFDLSKEFPQDKVREAINFHLRPKPVVVIDAEEVDENFHARFSAKKRYYVYRALERQPPPVIQRGRVWHVHKVLDIAAMKKAAKFLIGKHDFSSFRDSQCQAKSPEKTLDEIRIERVGDEVHFYFTATSFLHHMVRNIVGTLEMVGRGKWPPEEVKKILEAKDRKEAGQTAPAEGLYFLRVEY